tara:strand:+ start:614 stop:1615 length:1002 start_codon:yes stop_codon:yes gene_type:complete
MNKKVQIIAEAGVNHNGSISLGKQLIDCAAASGADFVKFQTFKAESLVSKFADKAAYQKKVTNKNESHFEMIKKLELNKSQHIELINYCKSKKIEFLSTAFDLESIDLLKKLKIKIFKIPSGEITNLPYLRQIGSLGQPVIMSTGMADLDEVKAAMDVLIEVGLDKRDLTILHCNTEYPTPINDVNLNAMLTIRDEFNVRVGYSDHTLGIDIPIAAVAMGARIIEKHFTIDRTLPGPDHSASLEPNELKLMVKKLRKIETALGDGAKLPTGSELKNINIARKSIIAKIPISKGDIFSEDNLTVKRPGSGISPMKWDSLIGKVSKTNYDKDDLI